VASLPVVALVGRPNVGKSTLFNRIVGDPRAAIVEDRARTTRDRLYAEADWNGRSFLVVDTGGLEIAPGDAIEAKVQEQARLAIAEADVIVFILDVTSGITPSDQDAAKMLRRATAPVLVAPNKADNAKRELDAVEFWALGWPESWPISAAHGRGVADLLDAIVAALPPETAEERARKTRETRQDLAATHVAHALIEGIAPLEEDGAEADLAGDEFDPAYVPGPVTIALVGRPNVGKSSLLNALLGEERMIVSEIPGTTRDAIDTRMTFGQGEIVLVDTAGIRRRGKVASGPDADRYSTLRALKAVDRADVVVLVIDAVDGLTSQDAHVAGYAVDAGKGLVLAINKWDLVQDKTDKTFDQYVTWIQRDAPFLDFAPAVSISAKTGQRVDRVLELAVDVWGERRKRIGTGELNRLLTDAVARQAPPAVKNRRPRLYYATQAGIEPPTFIFFANEAELIHFSYRRYLENRIRDVLGFHGAPIKLVFRNRGTERPRRTRPAAKARAALASGRPGAGSAPKARAGSRAGPRRSA
jgi:GTP-binding protein